MVDNLFDAAQYGNIDEARKFLKNGSCVNEMNQFQESPLILAAAAGHAEMVNVLIEHGADVQLKSYLGHTPFIRAAMRGYFETAMILIDCGAIIDEKVFFWAINGGNTELIQKILDHGVSVNAMIGDHNETALHLAAGSSSSGTWGQQLTFSQKC